MAQDTRVCICYPTDPLGVIPGGADTFIRNIVRWAPKDIQISVIGISTDPCSRKPGRWINCEIGDTAFRFYPAATFRNPASRDWIPITLKLTLGVMFRRPKIDADVLEFHRFEPGIAFWHDRRPKNAFVHQNMKVLHHPASDIRWSHMPRLYFLLEKLLVPHCSSVFVVHDDAVKEYRNRFPEIADRFRFTPTWVDLQTFFPPEQGERKRIREQVLAELKFDVDSEIIISIGRISSQKAPLLLAQAFKRVTERNPSACLVYIGDGALRPKLETFLVSTGLSEKTRLLGTRGSADIVRYLRASDLFVLASEYEGMPMAVLEALATGVPVVTTDVGEVRRVVKHGINGIVIDQRTPLSLAQGIQCILDGPMNYRGAPCLEAVQEYTPQRILKPVYENYRRLALGD